MTQVSTNRATAPAWSVGLAADLDANDATAKALVGGLSEEQLNWQPAAGCWSVGQCLGHLCVMNDVYLPPIAAAIQGKPNRRVEQIVPGWLGGWFIRNFVEPSPKSMKIGAPRKIRPTARVGLAVLEQFLAGNERCREVMLQALDKNVNHIRYWNPFIPGLRFRVGAGLEIIVSHERRHLLQARRVRDSANFPQ